MSKYDVILIHKIGSTLHITTPPEEDRATAVGNTHKSFGEDRTCSSEEMIADRQTHRQTDRHAHHNTPRAYRGQSKYHSCVEQIDDVTDKRCSDDASEIVRTLHQSNLNARSQHTN